MHKIFLILLLNPVLSFSQAKKPDSVSINAIVRKIDKLSETNNRLFVNNKKVKENWQHFDNKEFSRIVIDYIIDSVALSDHSKEYYSIAYSEKYYFKDGSLIYAYEREIFFLESIDDGTTWAGEFYFSKGKLIDHITLGHGKSESDEWDPEKDILQLLKKRKTELQLLK
jgi:hypothetical protein